MKLEMKIPWFYIWSPKYEIFHHILMSSLSDCPQFIMNPCFFPQSAFEYKRKAEDIHHFSGNALKLRMILNELKSLPEDSPVILSDADVFVTQPSRLYENCISMMHDYDIVGMSESIDDMKYINIGFIIFKNNACIQTFLTFLADTIEKTGEQDQMLFNKYIYTMVQNIGIFSTSVAIQSNMRSLLNSDFSLIQFLSSHNKYENIMFEKLISASAFIDITPVLHLVPHEVQEALILFSKDFRPLNPICNYVLT